MKRTILLSSVLAIFWGNAQVGINTTAPRTTLEVVGKPSNINALDGVLPPRITGDQLSAKTYTLKETGTFIFVTDAVTANPSTQVIDVTSSGYYFFNGTKWQKISAIEPWNVQMSTTPASSNTENIYQMGYVAIGTDKGVTSKDGNIETILTVRGSVRGAYAASSSDLLTPNTIVGWGSTAFGYNSEASEMNAIALGQGAKASEGSAIAIGDGAIAEGLYSVSIGNNTRTIAKESTTLGYYTQATAQRETVVGAYNAITNGNSNNPFITTDPMFQVGIGTGTSTGSKNGLTILKNGNVGIGIDGQNDAAKPVEMLDLGKGTIRIRSLNGGTTLKPTFVDANGNIHAYEIKSYATDAAADADTTLPKGAFYKLNGSRALYQKP